VYLHHRSFAKPVRSKLELRRVLLEDAPPGRERPARSTGHARALEAGADAGPARTRRSAPSDSVAAARPTVGSAGASTAHHAAHASRPPLGMRYFPRAAAQEAAQLGTPLETGMRVRARYLATTLGTYMTRWFGGSIIGSHDDDTFDVAYEDGDTEKHVARWFIRPLPPLTVGQRIYARWKASRRAAATVGATRWFPAIIRRVHADGRVDVRYDDGDSEQWVLPQYLRELTEAEAIRLRIGSGSSGVSGDWCRVVGVGAKHQVTVAAWGGGENVGSTAERPAEELQSRRALAVALAKSTAAALTQAAYAGETADGGQRLYPCRTGYGSEGEFDS